MGRHIEGYEEADPAPAPILRHAGTIKVKAGANITLDAFDATDPDRDHLSFLWLDYRDVGNHKKRIGIHGSENAAIAYFTAPKVAQKETAHFILILTHLGTAQLSKYQKVAVTIVPN